MVVLKQPGAAGRGLGCAQMAGLAADCLTPGRFGVSF